MYIILNNENFQGIFVPDIKSEMQNAFIKIEERRPGQNYKNKKKKNGTKSNEVKHILSFSFAEIHISHSIFLCLF